MVAERVRALACTGDRSVREGFESHCGQLRFGTLATLFTPLCQCLSEETLKDVGPFYLVSMPGEVPSNALTSDDLDTQRARVQILLFVAVLFIYRRTFYTCS